MKKISIDSVKQLTTTFFEKHWNITDAPTPDWNEPWNFIGGLPGGDTQGVYLLMNDDHEVIYIGVGASIVGRAYTGHGIGSRVNNYIRMADGQRSVPLDRRKYEPKGEWAERDLSNIVTLGFSQDYAYMAYALEAYLLREFETPYNKVRSTRAARA